MDSNNEFLIEHGLMNRNCRATKKALIAVNQMVKFAGTRPTRGIRDKDAGKSAEIRDGILRVPSGKGRKWRKIKVHLKDQNVTIAEVNRKTFAVDTGRRVPAFSSTDVGKKVEIEDDSVKVNNETWDVIWGNATHEDCKGRIRSVDGGSAGIVKLENGQTFENPEREDVDTLVNPEYVEGMDIFWELRRDCKDAKGRHWRRKDAGDATRCDTKQATVRCPCTNDHRPIKKQRAYEIILGKLMSLPVSKGKPVSKKFNRLKMAIAFRNMLGCWTKRCAGGSHGNGGEAAQPVTSSATIHTERRAVELLLAEAVDSKAGWDCG